MPLGRPDNAGAAWRLRAAVLACAAGLFVAVAPARAASTPVGPMPVRAAGSDSRTIPVAGAFVYPVGDELDFTKPHAGEATGFHITDSYLVRRGKSGQRTHRGIDLSNMRAGSPVRAIGSGVVLVAESKGLVKVRKAHQVKVATMVDGKRTHVWETRYRTTSKWRTGWGNYVVIRHVLPDGQTVHSLYAHLQPKSVLVKKGDRVAAGEQIGQIGKTGRASSPHLHLEIRKSMPVSSEDDEEMDPDDEPEATVEFRSFALLQTIDPVSFLERHVRRFEDLVPGTWQGTYALAACKDGVLMGDRGRFEPDDAITRSDFYQAITATFRLGTSTRPSYERTRDALGAMGIIDPSEPANAGDRLTRSEALEILLRCLDRSPAKGSTLGAFDRDQLCRDFNRVFAGEDAADRADRAARVAAAEATVAARKAADAEYEKALRAAKTKSSGTSARKRLKRRAVKPVPPTPRLDPGFEAIAQSKKNLSRAEACLLLASSFRVEHERRSALEQAASRVAIATSE